VLDDGDREWVQEMCDELGVRRLVRPAPRTHAKAGNLNHAIEHIDAGFLLVLDADHVPLPHALERTMGYFEDERVAFVQAPQVFFNRGFQHVRAAGDPTMNEQSLFYDVICRGKDRHDAAFWCGSSAVVRRDALVSIGGVATDTVVEDTHTAMRLHAAGWRSVYHHEVLAVGLAPEEVTSFLTQRGRWARGCFQVLRVDNPLWRRGLDWRQRLHYFSSVSHYFEGPQRLIGLIVPPLVLLTGTPPLRANPHLYLALFLPQLVLVPLATRVLARGRYRFLDGERFALVRVETYTRALKALVSNRPIQFAVTPKSTDAAAAATPWRSVSLPTVVAILSVVAVGYQISAQLAGLPGRLTIFACIVTVAWALVSAGLLGWVAVWARSIKHRRRAHRFHVRIDARCAVPASAVPFVRATVVDLNPFGLALTSTHAVALGRSMRVAFELDGRGIDVSGTVARCEPRGEGESMIGLTFDEVDSATRDAIVSWLFRRPFGPDVPVGVESEPAVAQPAARRVS
jgi:glycosyl transferase family 2/PilZ domain-containing protein